jgi:hypothetical protein
LEQELGDQPMKELSTFEDIRRWIKQYKDEWFDFTETEIEQIDNDWLRFSGALRHAEVIVIIGRRQQCIQCSVGYSGLDVPAEKRREICELINRLNFVGMLSMAIMNMEDGRIAWSAFLPFEEFRCQSSQFRMILLQTLVSADMAFPMFVEVLRNEKTAQEVVETRQREIHGE